MIVLKFLNIFLLFCASNSERTIEWHEEETERTVKPLIRKFEKSWKDHLIRDPDFHYKSHFGIVIKKGTTFTLTTETSGIIENLHFSCPTETTKNFIQLHFNNERSHYRNLTTDFDCVPMTSVSYNVPVELTIKTSNWMVLRVFDSRYITYQMSREVENEFYQNIQTYGFVENYYTQMLLSANDIEIIKSKGYSLYVALQNQVDVIKYYNYLTGASRYADKDDSFSYALSEKFRIFIRKETCETNCGYGAYFSDRWIACPNEVTEFLNPTRGSQWILLHEIAHYYDIKGFALAFGNIVDTWTNIFSAFYQHKFHLKSYWTMDSEFDNKETISKYQRNVPYAKWNNREKLHFFMSLFGYDGTDKSFREFNIRYYSKNSTGFATEKIIPTILEVFFDLYDINLLPYLNKVLNFKQYAIPLVNPDLEIRLLTGHPVMPAIDFNINPSDLPTKSEERDLRQYSPLMLMTKMKIKYVDVNFVFETPVDLTNRCLYLNNECHTIVGQKMNLKLLVDVYTIYIAESINEENYFSDIVYHTIVENTKINIQVKRVSENKICQPLIYYSFDARGMGDSIFLQIYINYKDMTIGIKQITDYIHPYYSNDVYFFITLERNGSSIFEYKFFGSSHNECIINVVHKFEINDQISINHVEPERLQMNLEWYKVKKNNTFVFTDVGLRDAFAKIDSNVTLMDINRINKFNKNYIDLSRNSYYQLFFAHCTNILLP